MSKFYDSINRFTFLNMFKIFFLPCVIANFVFFMQKYAEQAVKVLYFPLSSPEITSTDSLVYILDFLCTYTHTVTYASVFFSINEIMMYIHLFSKYLLCPYCVPGTRDMMLKKTPRVLAVREIPF